MDDSEYINPLQMMEVSMQEGESDISVQLSNSFEYPPVPTFDLQSEQFTYKQVTSPTVSSPPVLPKILPKPPLAFPGLSITNPRSLPTSSRITVKSVETVNESLGKEDFLKRLYDRKAFSEVFENIDNYPKNLNQVSADELAYHNKVFSKVSDVHYSKVHCTSCQKHIGLNNKDIYSHRMLSVLVCKKCFNFYGDGNFPKDKEDNTEIYCRWCGQGGEMVCCSYCPKVFCYKCIKANFTKHYLDRVTKEAAEWACFCCAQLPLWPLRAICRAVLEYSRMPGTLLQPTCCDPPKKIITPKPPLTLKSREMVKNGPGRPRLLSPILTPGPSRMPRYQQIRAATANRLRVPQFFGRPPRPAIMRPHPAPAPSPPEVPTNMPGVFVDHDVQDSMVVRFKLGGTKEYFIRININGSCMKMPNLPSKGTLPVQGLNNAFKSVKLIHSRLMGLKTKMDNGSSVTQQISDLQNTLATSQKILQSLQTDLERNNELFKKSQTDVIDLEEDDTGPIDYVWNMNQFEEVEVIECESPPSSGKRKPEEDIAAGSKRARFNGSVNGNEDPLALDDLPDPLEENVVPEDAGEKSNDESASVVKPDDTTKTPVSEATVDEEVHDIGIVNSCESNKSSEKLDESVKALSENGDSVDSSHAEAPAQDKQDDEPNDDSSETHKTHEKLANALETPEARNVGESNLETSENYDSSATETASDDSQEQEIPVARETAPSAEKESADTETSENNDCKKTSHDLEMQDATPSAEEELAVTGNSGSTACEVMETSRGTSGGDDGKEDEVNKSVDTPHEDPDQSLLEEIERVPYDSHDVVSEDVLRDVPEVSAK